MTEVQEICVSHNVKLDELCVEKDTMWAAIAAGSPKSKCQGGDYIDNDVFDPLKHKQFIKESPVAFSNGASSGKSKPKGTVGSNDNDPDPNNRRIGYR
ncbi:Hypothetical predicted protein [Mytilus galloprovincialis]|uniref:Uncharacterized protein n=1 Tax=Mytilus galloprovincialis TaxID=29158 RepID=A0A8B6E347_MYTGA|nr:Hypothetical predicted protein [Mytilus galloprovincialis]